MNACTIESINVNVEPSKNQIPTNTPKRVNSVLKTVSTNNINCGEAQKQSKWAALTRCKCEIVSDSNWDRPTHTDWDCFTMQMYKMCTDQCAQPQQQQKNADLQKSVWDIALDVRRYSYLCLCLWKLNQFAEIIVSFWLLFWMHAQRIISRWTPRVRNSNEIKICNHDVAFRNSQNQPTNCKPCEMNTRSVCNIESEFDVVWCLFEKNFLPHAIRCDAIR